MTLSALGLLGRFGDRLSLGARREISNVSPVPLARRGAAWRMPGLGRADYIRQMEAYGTDAVVYPIVNRLFTATGEAQWEAWNRSPSGREEDRTPATAPAAIAALELIRNPVPGLLDGTGLVEAGQQHNDLTGETNVLVGMTPGVAWPTDLWPCRPDRLEPVPETNGYLKGWVYTGPDGDRVPLEPWELLRHKLPNPLDMYRGMGPIQALLLELDSQRFGKEWQAQFFQNSARPGGILEVDKQLSDDEFDEMRDRWAEQHQGLGKAHRVAIIEQGAKWVETSFSMRDLQMVEMDGAARDKTLVAFGFPKAMLGIVEDVNRANAEAGEYLFARWLTQPRLKKWRGMWNNQLLPLYGKDIQRKFELDFVSPIPANSEVAIAELDVKSRALMLLTADGRYDATKVLDMLEWPDLGYTPAPPPPAPVIMPPAPQPEGDPATGGTVKDSGYRVGEGGIEAAMRWVARAEDDDSTCSPCSSNNGKTYRNRADAYADYPGGSGYIKCAGRDNCRCTVIKRKGQ